MYRISVILEVHAPILLLTPLYSEIPTPCFLTSPFTNLESLLCIVARFPSTLIPGWLSTDLPPLCAPHSLFPFPQRSPISNTCPPTTTLWHRLHIVRYNHIIRTIPYNLCKAFLISIPYSFVQVYIPWLSQKRTWGFLTFVLIQYGCPLFM